MMENKLVVVLISRLSTYLQAGVGVQVKEFRSSHCRVHHLFSPL
jgi:hypothetical protein